MKSYVSDNQIRLVGKAWEVKHGLAQMLQQGDPKLTVVDYLARLPARSSKKVQGHSAHILPFPLAAN
ncbi:hypothetical protein J2736_000569 [Paenibacillus qinlingensis]|uniref:Z-ring formation inhibitor MciZ n=1 Tax=Paenibacillus qinlingensis TaxID=1837343 RepID=A0ABU1NPH8_9BACL|nr:Z-ring formation inhibitor MciZ [Paenibacillus qinlingensis]MDR6549386.1 hypothetical protein [Paenibacillus qinlingensis]